jgi:nitrous oxidase accessory protein NosD
LEVTGFRFNCNATDHLILDDAGVDGGFFHHNTVYGSTTASVAIRLDLEGANWTVNDNHFILCKLPIDTAAAFQVIRRNYMTDVAASAKGVVIGAASHYSIVEGNIINMIVGTGEVGVTIASSADSCIVANNIIGAGDPISDSGTSTLLVDNFTNAFIAGANTFFFKGVIT